MDLIEQYLTTEEVAAAARTTVNTVRYWHSTGKGPHSIKRGKRRLYPASAVAAWLAGEDAPAVTTDVA